MCLNTEYNLHVSILESRYLLRVAVVVRDGVRGLLVVADGSAAVLPAVHHVLNEVREVDVVFAAAEVPHQLSTTCVTQILKLVSKRSI